MLGVAVGKLMGCDLFVDASTWGGRVCARYFLWCESCVAEEKLFWSIRGAYVFCRS
jgi:hypothetical protein